MENTAKLRTAWKVSKYGVISGPYFPVFGLNTDFVFKPNTGKYGPGITPYLDTFHAVLSNQRIIFELNCVSICSYFNREKLHISVGFLVFLIDRMRCNFTQKNAGWGCKSNLLLRLCHISNSCLFHLNILEGLILHVVVDYIHRDHPFSAYARFSKKSTFLNPWYAHTYLCVSVGKKC